MSDYPAGTILGAWPVTIGGLALDRVDDFGVEWSLTSVKGWGSASSSGETVDRPSGPGAWAPDWTSKAKEYTLVGSVDAETPQSRWAAEERLLGAITPEDTLMVMHDEVPRQTVVRLNGVVEIERTSVYTFDYEASVMALDPRRYSTVLRTVEIDFPSRVGGRRWPTQWPGRWTSGAASGDGLLRNWGNEMAWPTWRINGPASGPTITKVSTGEQMRFAVDLAEGDWLTVDTENHHILASGDIYAPRRDKFRGTWWGLDPKTLAAVRFGAGAATDGASLSGSWRDTYK